VRIVRLPDVSDARRRVAVGTFDGVHLGHRQVIAGCDSVLTFDPHPASVVAPAHAPRLLTDLPRKARLIEQLGVSELIVIPFDGEFASRSAGAFVEEVLVGALGAIHVSVGENFRFGNRAQGDPALLQADGRFTTTVHPLLEIDGEIVSSSHIRGLVAAGEVEHAARLLGAPFALSGEVVTGDRRGRELGFPTANVVPDERLACPGHGVYACLAGGRPKPGDTRLRRWPIRGCERSEGPPNRSPFRPKPGDTRLRRESPFRPAAVSIGVRPTFATGRGELIEAYLLDFEGDLYGETLELTFLSRLRGERRFPTAEALIAQMRLDVQRTREVAAAYCGD
jgi:riboflavin kinase / FMN adenylyltransferase